MAHNHHSVIIILAEIIIYSHQTILYESESIMLKCYFIQSGWGLLAAMSCVVRVGSSLYRFSASPFRLGRHVVTASSWFSSTGSSVNSDRPRVDFSDAKEALKAKSTVQLIKSYLIYTLFKYDSFVDNSFKVLN